jgi:hypothetical protein
MPRNTRNSPTGTNGPRNTRKDAALPLFDGLDSPPVRTPQIVELTERQLEHRRQMLLHLTAQRRVAQ